MQQICNTALLDGAEIFMPLAVLPAFVSFEKHAHSLSAEKLFGNKQGLHPARIDAVFPDYETSRTKTFSKISISPINYESWVDNTRRPLRSPACFGLAGLPAVVF